MRAQALDGGPPVKTTLIALGLYRSSGGPSKSIKAFADSLLADVVSWVDPLHSERENLIWSQTTRVRGSRLPVLRQLLVPQARDVSAAERLVESSNLVSCHSFWRWHNIWLSKAAVRHRVPYWFVPHGALDPYVFTRGPLAKQGFLAIGGERFLREARAVVCATQREYEKLRRFMPDAQPAIIPWPLDEGDFRRRDDEGRQKARHELGIPESARVFLYFGRLHSMKRPLETISAFAEPARSGAHLIVAGNDSDVSAVECKAEAARFGVAGSVHVVGPAYGDSRRALFDAADVYVSLSHRENFNFTAAEALASAVPVILSPGNDLGADLAAEKCSWTLRALEEAREAFRAACEVDDATLLEMGARGRAWAVEQLRYVTFERRIKAFASEISRL